MQMVRARSRWLGVIAISLCLLSSTPAQKSFNDLYESREFARALARARTQDERSALLVTKKHLVNVELRKALLAEGNGLLSEGSYSQAADLFGLARAVADQIGDTEGIGAASLNIGTVYYLQGDYVKALDSYQKARTIFEGKKDKAELARVLVGIGYVLKEQGQRSQALEALQQALTQLEALGVHAVSGELADVLNAIGGIHSEEGDYTLAIKLFERSAAVRDNAYNTLQIGNAFYAQGNLLQARDYYQKAFARLEQTGAAAGPGITTALLGSMANVYYQLGNHELALKYYQRNLVLLEKFNDKSGLAVTLEGIGNVYRREGDFARALESYLRSVKFGEVPGSKVNTATALGNIGLVRALQGDTAEALKYYAKSLEQFETAGNKVGMARMLANIGNSYYTQGNFDQALDAFQKCLALREAMDDKTSVAETLIGIGTTYATQRNFAPALESFQKAYSLFEQRKDKAGAAAALKGIANNYSLQEDYAQAVSFAERAVPLAAQADAQDLSWEIFFEIGKYHKALNQPAAARQAFEEAARISQAMQSRPAITDHYQTFPRKLLELYAELISLLVEQEKNTEAFLYADLAKVQALRSVLRKNELQISKTLSPVEKAQEQELTSALVALDLQNTRERERRQPDETVLLEIDRRVRQARTEHDAFRTKLTATHPRLLVYRGQVPQLKILEAAASLIPDAKSAFIQYVLTESKAYLFVLTKNSNVLRSSTPRNTRQRTGPAGLDLKVYTLSIQRRDLVERIALFRQSIARRDEDLEQRALQLYDLLLRPAAEQLKDVRTLVIAPDQELWALPFQALQPREHHYLIEQTALSYVPALSVLREMTRARTPGSSRSPNARGLVVFGNPKVTKELETRIGLTITGPVADPRLDAEPEFQKLRQISERDANIYAGTEASEIRAKTEVNKYGTLYFATRSLIDDVSPLSSFVVLAEDETRRQENGLLQAWEIMQLDSKARVVMLPWSASARGQLEGGSGEVGMMWAWFVSGTPTTLISQWTTTSTSTAELMAEFYLNLDAKTRPNKQRASKSEALKLAVQNLMQNDEYRHPYFWAGFDVIGDGQ